MPFLDMSLGPCTFESDQCQWTDTSDGQSKWQRQKASNNTEPPTDHTTATGDLSGLLTDFMARLENNSRDNMLNNIL